MMYSAYLLFVFYVVWVLGEIAGNLTNMISPQKPDEKAWFRTFLLAAGGLGGGLPNSINLVFNLWAILACGLLLCLRLNKPFRLGEYERVCAAGMCLMFMIGRPCVAWLSWVGAFIQDGGWLSLFMHSIIPPFALALGGFLALEFVIDSVGWQAMVIFGFATALPIFFFNQLFAFEQEIQKYSTQKKGLLGHVARARYWLTGEEAPNVPDDSKGARFATEDEIEAMNGRKGALFGYVNRKGLLLDTDKHILIMASTRSGKGVSLIIPHLLRYKGSAFVLDPKGENARATGRQRGKLNQKIHYLDPFGISGKPQSRFNPLSRFTPENMEAESKALAAALVIMERGERDHWTASGQQLLAALILHVFTSPDIPPHQKDLPTVRRLLLNEIFQQLASMKESDAAEGLVASLATSFVKTPEKELGSIISAAQRQTEILDNPFIAACLSASGTGDEVDFADWHKGTMTVFLSLSAPKFPIFSRWLRLVLTSALDEMTDILNPPPLPVCFMLDELATLGHLQAVENAVGLAAGYGIQLFTVFQDVAQMRDLYKGRWASFIGNAGVRALFNLDDYETAKYWSDFLGSRKIETMSEQQDIYGITKSQTQGETFRPLMTPEELMMAYASKKKINGRPVEPEKMLILAQGARPIEAVRIAYFNNRGFDGLWDDPRVNPPRASGLVRIGKALSPLQSPRVIS